MVGLELFEEELPAPIEVLERLFGHAGTSVIGAAFTYSFFVHPDAVRELTPLYPDFARPSRVHYPGKKKGERAEWEGETVKLDDNSHAQMAWRKYTGQAVVRRSGYGVRHIWGHPWDPNAFTAGWNLCYMPFWIGMLTEDQHPHHDLQQAIKQASWDLFFANNPVCEPPNFVRDPGFDLAGVLYGQRPQVIRKGQPMKSSAADGHAIQHVRAIRSSEKQSWENLRKAVRSLLNLPHDPFANTSVAESSKVAVRRMRKQTKLSLEQLKDVLDSMRP